MGLPAIFTVTSPSEWQPAPEWMNVHYLLRAERCPRSAALRYARYPQLWGRNGYPDKPTVAALAGIVVHAAVARIVQQFSENGCASIEDPRCSAVLKELGGYSKILTDTIADVAKTLVGNPRFEIVRDWSFSALQKRIPSLREHVQLQLCKIYWPVRTPNKERSIASKIEPSSARTPLAKGAHFEVEVRYPKLQWRGIIDFLDLAERSCAIKDFKTGESSEEHVLQIKVYGLLWFHDQELNPKGVLADQLTICYPTSEKNVKVEPNEMAELSASLSDRTAQVRKSVNGAASRANLSNENCANCDVRHLCADYWTHSRRATVPVMNGGSVLQDDVELELKSRKGEKTWSVECLISKYFPPKTALLLRWSAPNLHLFDGLKPGMIVRLSGAIVSRDDDSECGIVNCVNNADVIVFGT